MVVGGGSKEERKTEWEKGSEEKKRNFVVGVSDGSGGIEGIGIGGALWEKGEVVREWMVKGGLGLTVGEGEMAGVAEELRRVEGRYVDVLRRLIVGVDNSGVLENLRKGRGFCGEIEQEVRRVRLKLIEKGWELRWEWVLGHVRIEESERVDEKAKRARIEGERGWMGVILVWENGKREGRGRRGEVGQNIGRVGERERNSSEMEREGSWGMIRRGG